MYSKRWIAASRSTVERVVRRASSSRVSSARRAETRRSVSRSRERPPGGLAGELVAHLRKVDEVDPIGDVALLEGLAQGAERSRGKGCDRRTATSMSDRGDASPRAEEPKR
jgi:hypothetical protein